MIDETEFNRLADATLQDFLAKMEAADTQGLLECDIAAGVLTIESDAGHIWVVSKHAPSQQLWLASRFSGGLHFAYDGSRWVLPDGRELSSHLASELNSYAGIKVSF